MNRKQFLLVLIILLVSFLVGRYSMGQDSAPWDKGGGGDLDTTVVWSGPYSSAEYADMWSKILGSNQATGFVVPGYNNNLEVDENSPAAMSVLVDTGALFLRGRVYELTSQTAVTIEAADGANPRLDRVVAEVTFASQTIRVAVVKGTAAATPSLPALTQNATTYQVDLAHVWVPALAASISYHEISDKRTFAGNFFDATQTTYGENLVRNSEFMGFSNPGSVIPPDGWELHSSPSDLSAIAKPAQMSRGQAVQITAAAGGDDGITQTFPVKASTLYSIRLLYKVTAGDQGAALAITDSAASNFVSRYLYRTGSWLTETMYLLTESDATELEVRLTAFGGTDIVSFGQVLVVEGYTPGPFRQVHEYIPFEYLVQDASWDGDAKSTGDTTIDLTADYGALIPAGTRAISVSIQGNDSGSAGASPTLSVRHNAGVDDIVLLSLDGVTNDKKRSVWGIVALRQSLVTAFTISVTASGAGTLDAYVFITGIYT